MSDRTQIVHQNFLSRLKNGDIPDTCSALPEGLRESEAVELLTSQIISRRLDMQARIMQSQGIGFYTIGSSGHEGSAAIAHALSGQDMAFLHYRDAAFFIHRAYRERREYPIRDMLLSFSAAKDDPVCSGRHKVLGAKDLHIPPQTSTIASHLPKAVGAAFSIGLNKKLKNAGELDSDSLVMCSFGDASVNHSTAQGAFNSALWSVRQSAPLPLLFVSEDNAIGISTKTPKNWVRDQFEGRSGLAYFPCNGLDLFDTYTASLKAAHYVRSQKKPAFLHMSCVRLYGHAGADMPQAYLSDDEITAIENDDPLLHSAAIMVHNGILTPEQILKLYEDIGEDITKRADKMHKAKRLETAADVCASLIPPKKKAKAAKKLGDKIRQAHFGPDWKFMDQPQHMARLLNWALHDLMMDYPEIVMVGEDIGPKGGVYNITAKAHARFGPARVINSILDEQSILGLSIGMAHNNILPVPEIQFLAYLHNAEDQLRGEAATLPFFSNGQFTNPMVIRIAGLAYQRGFGGHFHNDNSLAVIRDIPGVILACPSNGYDAVKMMREAVRLAREEQRVVVFVEPIALYMTRDLHTDKDGGWSFCYPAPHGADDLAPGDIYQHGDGDDLAILSYANGYYLSRKAAKILKDTHGIDARVIDMRWLSPLPMESILQAVEGCRNILIVDETRKTGSVSEELFTRLVESGVNAPIKRLTAEDSFIPLGRAYAATLPSIEGIINYTKDMF